MSCSAAHITRLFDAVWAARFFSAGDNRGVAGSSVYSI